jgi:hypothetical protein
VINSILEFWEDIWISDSGAVHHTIIAAVITVIQLYDSSEKSTVDNGETAEATRIGNLRCNVDDENGQTFQIYLQDVKFVPLLWIYLAGVNKVLKTGLIIGSDDTREV